MDMKQHHRDDSLDLWRIKGGPTPWPNGWLSAIDHRLIKEKIMDLIRVF